MSSKLEMPIVKRKHRQEQRSQIHGTGNDVETVLELHEPSYLKFV